MEMFAHSRPHQRDRATWQQLLEHLTNTGVLAASHAPEALRELARLAGLWHDVGKYQEAFQRYIATDPDASNESDARFRSVPHAAAGAALALERYGSSVQGLMLALVIEAHHGSLKAAREIIMVVQQKGRPLLENARLGGLPKHLETHDPGAPLRPSGLAVRMLFSALVDADLLDTESWDRGKQRPSPSESISVLRDRLDAACAAKAVGSNAGLTPAVSALRSMRQKVLSACLKAADEAQGAFTLTVPTGGGKTLSGLAFALHHAVRHDLHRVIVVAPYTSILEQTARVYREILGEHNVIEHHSNLAPVHDTDRNRQACENWDAPVIVTTSVQLLESLHAAHKAQCRKLHRVARSVVLLDEVQTFPADLLLPIHAMFKHLVEDFGVTIVHGTATQPLLARAGSLLPKDLQIPLREITPDPTEAFRAVGDRFRIERLGDLNEGLPIESLAAACAQHPSAMVITHRRADAQELAELLGPGCLHLSAAMCAEHRTDVLDQARRWLRDGRPCVLVATQLVEAGVDIDFPVVFRAMAGLETLAQAAGRCNREMKLPAPGRLIVYRAASQPPPGFPRLAMQIALGYFEEDNPDLSDPFLFPKYTKRVMRLLENDKHGLLDLEDNWDFPEVAAKFRMIEDSQFTVVAPYGRAKEFVEAVRRLPTRDAYRKLQRFTVSLRTEEFRRLRDGGWIEPVIDGEGAEEEQSVLWAVPAGMEAAYDLRCGFGPRNKESELAPLIA